VLPANLWYEMKNADDKIYDLYYLELLRDCCTWFHLLRMSPQRTE
jgi:hypothetical protein